MPSLRERIRLTDAELALLYDEVQTFTLGTIGHDGVPHLTAMWFVVVDGTITFWTYRKAQKTVNLRRDPRLSCLFDAGDTYNELRGAMVQGRAELTDDYDDVLHIGAAVGRRYNPTMTHAESEEWAARQAAKRTGVRVAVENVASWDHRKLG